MTLATQVADGTGSRQGGVPLSIFPSTPPALIWSASWGVQVRSRPFDYFCFFWKKNKKNNNNNNNNNNKPAH